MINYKACCNKSVEILMSIIWIRFRPVFFNTGSANWCVTEFIRTWVEVPYAQNKQPIWKMRQVC